MKKGRQVMTVLLGFFVSAGILIGFFSILSLDSTNPVVAAIQAKKPKSSSSRKLDDAYKRLVSELQYGLKQKGVSPDWRDGQLKKFEALRKQGLDEKRVKELQALFSRINVGGGRGGSCASNIAPVFTHHVAELEKIDGFNPIGGIGGGSPGRSYIGVKSGMETAVYAPVDAMLENIIYIDRGEGHGEYGLFLRPSCEVEVLLDHIDRLSDAFQRYAPAKPALTTQTGQAIGTKAPNIKVKAGELLGYTNGTRLARTFDFLVLNYGRKNTFINPKRWEWEQALYGSCPYEYFTPELRAAYQEKLGKPSDRGLIKASSCGNPSHDVAGTASGGWFKETSTDKRGEYLAIARQYDGVQIVYRKDGLAYPTTQDVQQGKPYFNLMDDAPQKYPSEMKPGDSVCYSGNGQWGYVKLHSATELLFASGSGSCPSEFPQSQATIWIR